MSPSLVKPLGIFLEVSSVSTLTDKLHQFHQNNHVLVLYFQSYKNFVFILVGNWMTSPVISEFVEGRNFAPFMLPPPELVFVLY
jgi:hypothetical protein